MVLSQLFGRTAQSGDRAAARGVFALLKRSEGDPSEAFSPTRPQFSDRSLLGREDELARIMRAICQEHAHVVLFADRGRGKSSLANCVAEQLQRLGGIVARTSCNPQINFDTLIRNLLRSLPASLAADMPPDRASGCESLLPREPVTPRDVLEFPGLFGGRHLTLLIEEFDRLSDETARSMIADASKQLSDRGAPVSFFIVGVADSVDELLGHNPSVHRSVVPVELPLLSEASVRSIIDAGFRACGLVVPASVADLIVKLAHGAPYMTHLLGLRTAQAAADAGRKTLAVADVVAAASQIVREGDPAVRSLLTGAAETLEERSLANLLLHVLAGERDAFGRFTAEHTGPDEMQVAGQPISAHDWSQLVTAGLVRRVGPPSRLFSFSANHLEHYVLLRELSRDYAEKVGVMSEA